MPVKPAQIRPFRQQDIAAVQDLYLACFNEPSPPEAHFLQAYKPDSEAAGSLVCESGGRIIGFVGATLNPFDCGGSRLIGAVTSKFMVHPDERSPLLAVRLLKQLFAGPQDFSYSDLVNASARPVWQAVGAKVSWLNSINWHYRRSRVDAVVAGVKKRFKPGESRTSLSSRVAPLEDLQATMARFPSAHRLRPLHSDESVQRALELFSANHPAGHNQLTVACDGTFRERGWFVYHTNWYNQVLVLGMGAEMGYERAVFECALQVTSRIGRFVSGWLQPGWLPVHSELSRVTLKPRKYWAMVHSRNALLVDEFIKGTAYLSPLDGECPMTCSV